MIANSIIYNIDKILTIDGPEDVLALAATALFWFVAVRIALWLVAAVLRVVGRLYQAIFSAMVALGQLVIAIHDTVVALPTTICSAVVSLPATVLRRLVGGGRTKKANPWNDFQSKNKDKGWSRAQMRAAYHAWKEFQDAHAGNRWSEATMSAQYERWQRRQRRRQKKKQQRRRFFKGGQFLPGGGRAPAGGCFARAA